MRLGYPEAIFLPTEFMMTIRIKICGITTDSDAQFAKDAGADAIGLNFYAKSKRYIRPADAAKIVNSIGQDSLALVGVFVNSSASEIASIATEAGLSHVQLHGDESVEIVEEVRTALPSVKVIRAIRILDNDFEVAQQEISLWENADVDLLLLDAASPTSFGGTGNRLDWGQLPELMVSKPWLLAGGLTPDNVGQAIQMANPTGVDVASGVESAPGIKEDKLVSKFVSESKSNLS